MVLFSAHRSFVCEVGHLISEECSYRGRAVITDLKSLGYLRLLTQSQLQFSSSSVRSLRFGEGFALLNKYISLASLQSICLFHIGILSF